MEEHVNRKATIVIEHIILASDVAHTMQHWHVFCKWNEKLYNEMYAAYLCGRLVKDPSIDWYDSEIGFFDHYIIPYWRGSCRTSHQRNGHSTNELLWTSQTFIERSVPRNLLPIHSSSSSINSSPASSKSYLPNPGTAGLARDLINIGLPHRQAGFVGTWELFKYLSPK